VLYIVRPVQAGLGWKVVAEKVKVEDVGKGEEK
jgi:hypothetical protein